MTTCRICETPFEPFISFGQTPIANGFLTPEQYADEYFFELAVGFCPKCTMVQLIDQPEREQMFNDHYAFYSSTSKHMADHFQEFAEHMQRDYITDADPFVVEIGSNDGIMLGNFAKQKIRHLGVEPSGNVAAVAQEKGINTQVSFFDEAVAKKVVESNGLADVMTAANVICHIPYLHSIFGGVKTLLKPQGVFAFEEPYIGDIVQKTSYDQIYDEHVFFFSVASVQAVCAYHDLEVIDIAPQETHGGSMRYYISHKGARPVSERVAQQLDVEKQLGLQQAATYDKLRQKIEKSKVELFDLLTKLKQANKRVVGYGATSKSTTVINYCGLTPELIEFISDTTPIKQGKFSPGAHIPVRPYEEFQQNYPDYALLFAWNHAKEIMTKEDAFKASGGQWIVFVPEVKVLV